MPREKINSAVMFADIVGSTQLYEKLGDRKAQGLISRALGLMEGIVVGHHGQVVKTIGDEIMCRFASAEQAVLAAIAIHEQLERADFDLRVCARIGLHYDSVLLENGDVFGDGVNVAARMAQLARSGQIVTTAQTVEVLSEALKMNCRGIDHAPVKGKSEPIHVHEVVWEHEDEVTRIAGVLSTQQLQDQTHGRLLLRHGDLELDVDKNLGAVLGRSPQVDMPVNAVLASRVHGRIEYRRGKFIYIDQSTNGTFIANQSGKEVYLKREELALSGQGVISLGSKVSEDDGLVYFECR